MSLWRRSARWPLAVQLLIAAVVIVVIALVVNALVDKESRTEVRSREHPDSTTIPAAATRTDPRLGTLRISVPGTLPDYDRDLFGGGWRDDDGDCLDTRDEVLIAASTTRAVTEGCAVVAGTWIDPWSGRVANDPGQLEIDHTVALANAWRSGAWSWTAERRAMFANDAETTDALVPMSSSANRSKADSGPEVWKPGDRSSWCAYAHTWARIKRAWDLSVTASEWDALVAMAETC